jgi:hypothetical protein
MCPIDDTVLAEGRALLLEGLEKPQSFGSDGTVISRWLGIGRSLSFAFALGVGRRSCCTGTALLAVSLAAV